MILLGNAESGHCRPLVLPGYLGTLLDQGEFPNCERVSSEGVQSCQAQLISYI